MCIKKLVERFWYKNKRVLSYGGWIGIGSNDLWLIEIILYWKYVCQVLNSWKMGVKKYYRDIMLCGKFFLCFVCM